MRPLRPSAAALAPAAILLLLGVMWGGSFSLAKIARLGDVHPFALMFWQSAGGAAIVAAFALARGGQGLGDLRPRHMGFFLVTGLLAIVIPSTAIYWAAAAVPAGVLSMLVTTAPMLTYGLALATGIERKSPLRAAGIALGFVAVALIVLPEGSLPGRASAGWVLIGLIAPVCYAASNLFIAHFRPPGTGSAALAAGMLGTSALVGLPLVLATGSGYLPGNPWRAVDIAVLTIPVITGVAHIFVFKLIHMAGPVYFSQVGYFVTLAGIVWGMVLFGERPGPWIWAALALMFAGLALVNLRREAAVTRAAPDSEGGSP